jgi:hypothetical protein
MIVHKTIQFIYLYILFSNEKKINNLPFARHVREDVDAGAEFAVFEGGADLAVFGGGADFAVFGGGAEALKIKQILSTCRQHHINKEAGLNS